MEISVGDYGKVMFEMMQRCDDKMPANWLSIAEQARPLVNQLIALKDSMNRIGSVEKSYDIYSVRVGSVLSVSKAQRRLEIIHRSFGCKASELKEGDLVWLDARDVGMEDPKCVAITTDLYVAIEDEYDRFVKVRKDEVVLRAPKGFLEDRDTYFSDEYWLGQEASIGVL